MSISIALYFWCGDIESFRSMNVLLLNAVPVCVQVCCIKQICAYARKRTLEFESKKKSVTRRYITEYGETVMPVPSSSVCEYPYLSLYGCTFSNMFNFWDVFNICVEHSAQKR